MYAICEFIDSSIVAGTYAIAFVLAMEMLGPSKRVFGGTLIACSYTIGEVLLGFTAMYTLNFRWLVRIVYCPMLLVLIYFWFIPESVRWLWVNGRNKEAVDIVVRAAQTNKIKLTDETLALYNSCGVNPSESTSETCDQSKNTQSSGKGAEIKKVFRSRVLMLRLANCFLVWITCAFVYYGLSLSAVSLAGNKFMNFMLVCTAEIPGYVVTNLLSGRIGRKWTLSLSLIVCGLSCIGSQYVPVESYSAVRLCLFLLGKSAITVSFTTLYVFTSEMFPTSLRNSLVLICSTVGRIGSMSAPQTPLLVRIIKLTKNISQRLRYLTGWKLLWRCFDADVVLHSKHPTKTQVSGQIPVPPEQIQLFPFSPGEIRAGVTTSIIRWIGYHIWMHGAHVSGDFEYIPSRYN